VNIAHLRYARAVARERSFSQAARVCSVTQPALSIGIAVLERMLGGRLFDRSTRGVTPTALGERVLPLIESTLRGLDAVVAEAKLTSGHQVRPLRVGVTSLINRELIGRTFEAARAVAPGRDVILRAASLTELHAALIGADLDLILAPMVDPPSDLQRATVAEEPVVLIAAPSPHPSGNQAITTPIELRDTTTTPLILPTNACGLAPFTHKVFADNGLTPRTYAGQAHDCRVVQDWVALGLGSAILPQSKVHDATPARPIHVEHTPVTIAYEVSWLATSPIHTEIATIAATLANPEPATLEVEPLLAAG